MHRTTKARHEHLANTVNPDKGTNTRKATPTSGAHKTKDKNDPLATTRRHPARATKNDDANTTNPTTTKPKHDRHHEDESDKPSTTKDTDDPSERVARLSRTRARGPA